MEIWSHLVTEETFNRTVHILCSVVQNTSGVKYLLCWIKYLDQNKKPCKNELDQRTLISAFANP